jgi:hypothetical protein
MGFDRSKVIFDRVSPISDTVYRLAEGRPILVEPDEQIDFLRRFDAVVIYCRLHTSYEMVGYISRETKPHKPADYLEKVIEVHPKVVDAYEQVMGKVRDAGIPVLQYNSDLLRWLACVA